VGGCVIIDISEQWSASPSFLIVSLRYIGDVLLSTPLALSIKEHIPQATVDYLVFAGTEGVLRSNPLIRTIHTIAPGTNGIHLLASLWKRYDYSIGATISDRTTFFVAATGRNSVGFTTLRPKDWWKRYLLGESHLHDDTVHVVPLILKNLRSFAIPSRPRVMAPYAAEDLAFVRNELGEAPYVILHPYTRRPCKEWLSSAWGELARLILKIGLRPVFTVSPVSVDRAVQEDISRNAPSGAIFLSRPYTFSQLAAVIAGGRGYVGVDTVVTHIAAALDVNTVALYGPTLVRHWGPWPNDWSDCIPYDNQGGIQRRGAVTVLQKDWPCVPCNREECEISTCGRIECLAQLSAKEVFDELVRVVGLSQ
jgi:heptosyltransferase-3